ncbi:MAG: SusD/RagB family nutrient-binding outer membrane lipoprotein [Candidatus Azobacteroides sp.]|nr:SusD/RagB family nutrient-binding outer membrane lipoprotein [Candidatus Azobacteroides sp.]
MKMKKQYLSIIAGFVALLTMGACTDGFEKINTNPNRLTSAEPEFIFGLSPVTTFRAIGGAQYGETRANNWYVFGNYGQMWAVEGGGAPHFSADGASDAIWNDLYSKSLTPLFNIIDNYGDNVGYKNRVAIAKIWRSYVFSILVGCYGPIPYTDACNANVTAKYDKEEDVYLGILAELKEAYEAIDVGNAADKYPKAAEPFLQSDLTRWAQFAHCIRLRTAMRIADCDVNHPDKSWLQPLAATAKAIVAEELNNAENGLLISNNTGNFYMTFDNSDQNTKNPLFFIVDQMTAAEKKNQLGNLPVLHESLMMWIKPGTYNDPVLSVYVQEGNGGTRARPVPDIYLGRPNSMGAPTNYTYPSGWVSPYANVDDYPNYATIGQEFLRSDGRYYFFSYPELCFIRAEASLKGFWTGNKTAEQYYYDGIDARCLKYSGALNSNITQAIIDAYKDFPGIKWSTPTDLESPGVLASDFLDFLGGFTNSVLGGEEDNLKRIVVQHWISLFGQNIDAWILLRRTELIQFKPNFNADQNDGYVSGTWAFIPERLPYPGGERRINTAETQIAIQNYLYDNTLHDVQDRVTFRLIFAADNPGLPAPPMGSQAYAAFPYPLPNQAMNRVNK